MSKLSDHLRRTAEGKVELQDELHRSLDEIHRKNTFYHAIKDHSAAEDQIIQIGPLAGATVVVKDNIHVNGYPTCVGMKKALPDGFLEESSLVTRICELGGAIVGKSHCAELSLGGTGLNTSQGTPRNPHDDDVHRAPGGSSSGTAVAVATDMAMIGLCTDTGGSARVPASVCGLVGYRPSEGVFPDDGMFRLGIPDRISVICKTVGDVRLFSDIVSPVDLSETEPAPKRIKAFPTALLQALPEEHLTLYHQKIEALRKAGHSIDDVDPQFFIGIFAELDNAQVGNLGASELAMYLDANLPDYELDISPRVQKMIQQGRTCSADSVQRILEFIIELSAKKSDELFSTTDFLVTPTLPVPPPTIDSISTDEGYEAYSDRMLDFTVMGTFFWGAAITVPNGFDKDSLPVGFQIIGPAGTDKELFSIASTIEALPVGKSWDSKPVKRD